MNGQLRFVMRDGVKVLQQEVASDCKFCPCTEWQDVPLVEEPRKAREFWIEIRGTQRLIHDVGYPAEVVLGSKLYKVREILDGEK